MQNLIQSIEKNIQKSVDKFIQSIVEQYDSCDPEVLHELWNSKSIHLASSGKEPEKKPEIKPETKPTKSPSSDTKGCPYVFSKGDKSGSLCGTKPKGDNVYCSVHKKYEGQASKERKVLPEPKKSASSTIPSTDSRALRLHIILKRPVHPQTGLVFRSQHERVVIGKVVNDKLKPLTPEDIQNAMKWGFAYDENDPEFNENKEEEEAEGVETEVEDEEIEKKVVENVKKDAGSEKVEKKVEPKKVAPKKEDSEQEETDDDEQEKVVAKAKDKKEEKKVEPKKEKNVEPKKDEKKSDKKVEKKVEPKKDKKPDKKVDKKPEPKKATESQDSSVEEDIADLEDEATIVNQALGINC